MEKLTAEEAGGRVEEEEKKKLYVFLSHCFGMPYVHSFYEVPTSNHNDLPPAVATKDEEEQRSPLLPLLYFTLEEHGRQMCCAHLGSKVYFIGGLSEGPAGIRYSLDVYILDTSAGMPQPGSNPHENKDVYLKKGLRMNFPKLQPVAFEAQGKIFVLCSTFGEPGVGIYPFEMFTPPAPGSSEPGEWQMLAPPPFGKMVESHLVVDHRVLVCCHGHPTVYMYDILSQSWDRTIDPTSSFPYGIGFGSLFLENKLFTSSYPYSVLWSTLDWSSSDDESLKLPPCNWKRVPVPNSFLSPVPSSYLAGLGKGRFCLLQVGCSRSNGKDCFPYNRNECLVDLTVFDSSTTSILGSAAFTVNPFRSLTLVVAAFAV